MLVVDDYADTRELVRMLLEMKGCSVFEAANGREAVDLTWRVAFSFILMDLEMPVLDGFEASREIRARPETSVVPVIAFSANCSGERRALALAAGCTECIAKPIGLPLIEEW